MASERVQTKATDLELSRVIDAPRELVFKLWTETEHFKQWFGPHGVEVPFCRIEPRPGGILHFCHRLRGIEIWVKGEYREFVPPERLVFALRFVDSEGHVAAHPMFPDWPLEAVILTTVTFADRGPKTELNIHQQVLPDVAGAESVFQRMRDASQAGWGETLERLVAYVRSRS